MSDLAYPAFVLAAAVLGALCGAAAHFARAHMRLYPEIIFDDGDIANEVFVDDYLFEKHAMGAEWTEGGFWDGESVRNLVYYAASGFLGPVALGVFLWPQREALAAGLCRLLHGAGLTPPVC